MRRLNYHHLEYFRAVAQEGHLTRTAKRMHISQSALSSQIRQLEDALGERLFDRTGRSLKLTEAGRLALDYAEAIFRAGEELVATFDSGRRREDVLRIGGVATLSRNFQSSFVAPILDAPQVRLSLRSGGFDELLDALLSHDLDVVLANRSVAPSGTAPYRARHLAQQQVSLVGSTPRESFRFPGDADGARLVVPGIDSEIRTAFDAICAKFGLRVDIVAEVDDMAMLRLAARDMGALAVVPSVVVRDELQSGALHELCIVPELFENFYAITVARHYEHPLLASLLRRSEQEVLAMEITDPPRHDQGQA